METFTYDDAFLQNKQKSCRKLHNRFPRRPPFAGQASASGKNPPPILFAINDHPQAPGGTLFQFSKRALYFFGALLLIPWLIVLALLLSRPDRGSAAPPPASAPAPGPIYDDYVQQCAPGPWGELQYSRLVIEPPDDFVLEEYITAREPQWLFPGYSVSQVRELFVSAGLADAQLQAFTAPAAMFAETGGVIVRPPAELVLGLTAEARAKIYAALSRHPENPDQHEPYRFRADSADEWFADCGLRPETIAMVRKVLYTRGNSLLCSDHGILLGQIPSRPERVRLVRTLARKSTLLVKLRVRPSDDVVALADYWGRGSRRKDMRALLSSISNRPQGITVDVAHLLPSFARSRLFTYRPPSHDPRDNNKDCHWTSLNFYNDPPDDRFTEIDAVRTAFEQEYQAVSGPPRLGDILVFATSADEVIHSCVYIADDIVFTKNGASDAMPWILMNLPDVVAFYPADPPLTIRTFRRKGL